MEDKTLKESTDIENHNPGEESKRRIMPQKSIRHKSVLADVSTKDDTKLLNSAFDSLRTSPEKPLGGEAGQSDTSSETKVPPSPGASAASNTVLSGRKVPVRKVFDAMESMGAASTGSEHAKKDDDNNGTVELAGDQTDGAAGIRTSSTTTEATDTADVSAKKKRSRKSELMQERKAKKSKPRALSTYFNGVVIPEEQKDRSEIPRSKYRGVSWDRRMHLWRCKANAVHIGFFQDEEEAALAYDRAKISLHKGKGSLSLNFPEKANIWDDEEDDEVTDEEAAGAAAGADGSKNNLKKSKVRSSKYKGVMWDYGTRSWRAKIKVKSKTWYLGVFSKEEDAAHAYDSAASFVLREAFSLNFPDVNYAELPLPRPAPAWMLEHLTELGEQARRSGNQKLKERIDEQLNRVQAFSEDAVLEEQKRLTEEEGKRLAEEKSLIEEATRKSEEEEAKRKQEEKQKQEAAQIESEKHAELVEEAIQSLAKLATTPTMAEIAEKAAAPSPDSAATVDDAESAISVIRVEEISDPRPRSAAASTATGREDGVSDEQSSTSSGVKEESATNDATVFKSHAISLASIAAAAAATAAAAAAATIPSPSASNVVADVNAKVPATAATMTKAVGSTKSMIGVTSDYGGFFSAHITFQNHRLYLGTYHSAEEAGRAHDIASLKLLGRDRLGELNCGAHLIPVLLKETLPASLETLVRALFPYSSLGSNKERMQRAKERVNEVRTALSNVRSMYKRRRQDGQLMDEDAMLTGESPEEESTSATGAVNSTVLTAKPANAAAASKPRTVAISKAQQGSSSSSAAAVAHPFLSSFPGQDADFESSATKPASWSNNNKTTETSKKRGAASSSSSAAAASTRKKKQRQEEQYDPAMNLNNLAELAKRALMDAASRRKGGSNSSFS